MTGARISPLTQLFIIVTNVKGNLYLIWLNLTFIITLGFGAKNWLGKSKFLLGWLPMVFIGVYL